MIKASLNRSMLNYSAFTKYLGISKVVIIIVYIDNFLFFRTELTKINILKSFVTDQYKMKNLSFCRQFNKIKLEQNLEVKTISLSQRVYNQMTLENANMLDSKLVHSTFISGIDCSKNKNINKLLDKDFIYLYQSHVDTYI